MRKNEFLSQLQKALENELDSQKVKEHVNYYENYIQSEINKGVPEEEVLYQLGDPWAITKTILLSEKINEQEYESETAEAVRNEEENMQVSGKYNWKMLAVIVVAILAVLLVLSVIFGVIAIVVRLAIRFAVPLLVIALVWKFFFAK